MRSRNLLSFTILFLLGIVMAGCGAIDLAGEPGVVATLPPRPTEPPAQDVLLPVEHPDLSVGAAIYAQNCTSCHGIDGAGNGELVLSEQVPHPGDMTDWEAVSVDLPTDWYDIITNGNLANLMPPWAGSLTVEERWSVAMYNYTRSYTLDQFERGAVIYEQQCAACHGESGAGDGPLAVEAGDLSDPATMVQLSDEAIYTLLAAGSQNPMHTFAGDLSEEDMRDVTAYTRTLSLTGSEIIGQAPAEREASIPADDTAPANLEDAFTVIESGTITGNVDNGTEGSTISEDTMAELHVFDESFEEIDVLQAPVVDGMYALNGVTINPAYTYVALVEHAGREFISQPTPGRGVIDDTLNLPILVYDVTPDESVLSIDSMAIQVTPQENRLQVVQFVIFNNESDRLFSVETTTPDGETVVQSATLSLPPGSVVGGFNANPDRYIIDEEAFTVTDTQPILPGDSHLMQLVYFIPFDRDAIIEHPLDYDMNGLFRLLMSTDTVRVEGDTLDSFGPVTVGQSNYFEYGTQIDLTAGEAITYELARMPGNIGGAAGGMGWLPTTLFVLSGASALLAVGLFIYGRRSGKTDTTDKAIDALVTQIAQLDNAHEAGEINHDVYQRQRADLKAELRQLMEGKSETA